MSRRRLVTGSSGLEDAVVKTRPGNIALGAATAALLLTGCAGTGSPSRATNEARLEAIPPVPAGFEPLATTSTGFRSARIAHPARTWVVNFDDGITKIETSPYVVTKLDPKWYPEEGGADAALCRGYQRGNETLVRMQGSSDMVTEETWILFENAKLREVVKYSILGQGLDPMFPPDPIPYAKRVKRQAF